MAIQTLKKRQFERSEVIAVGALQKDCRHPPWLADRLASSGHWPVLEMRGPLHSPGLHEQKLAAPKPPTRPVEAEELKFAILEAIVEKFGDRPLSWETVEEALQEVNIEVKMMALRAGRRA